jgi:DNA invertase Pin-like site-specific DNA recombinase
MNTKDSRSSSSGAILCAIYARQAATEQSGSSTVADQLDRCRKAAQENGWSVVEDFIRTDVGRSGTSIEGRTGLKELMALAATRPRPFECLLCTSSDRLARNWSNSDEIVNAFTCAGVSLHFVQGGNDTSLDTKPDGKVGHMRKAVSYARVSSKEQELGCSLEPQVKTLRGYAASNSFKTVKEFTFSESAKQQGRKHFNEMLDYLRQHRDVRAVIVEKTDRLCRNLNDFVLVESLVEELGLEVHLVKEGQVLRRGSKSQDKLVQELFALLDRNYILNLQEEILKGQAAKAEMGQYPGRAPFGYAHDRETRTIVTHPAKASVVNLIFELYSSGTYSVEELRKKVIEETGERLSKSLLHRILKSRFYLGFFTWRGREYTGKHPGIINPELYLQVQAVLQGCNGASKPNVT